MKKNILMTIIFISILNNIYGQDVNINKNYKNISKYLENSEQVIYIDSFSRNLYKNKIMNSIDDRNLINELNKVIGFSEEFLSSNYYYLGKIMNIRSNNFNQHVFLKISYHNFEEFTNHNFSLTPFIEIYILNHSTKSNNVLSKILVYFKGYIDDAEYENWGYFYLNDTQNITIQFRNNIESKIIGTVKYDYDGFIFK